MGPLTNKTQQCPRARNSDKEVVIITGSSGLIGTRIIKRLAKKFRVIGLDKVGNPFPPAEAECVCFDITSEGSIRAAMERIRYGYGEKIASVIHLAAYYDFSGKPSPLYEEVTVKGTERFIKVLQNFNVGQFVFSSTNLIYKPTEPGVKIAENCPLAPNWDYPEPKVDTEEIIRKNRGICMRFFYGWQAFMMMRVIKKRPIPTIEIMFQYISIQLRPINCILLLPRCLNVPIR